jgi:hypothetical protein
MFRNYIEVAFYLVKASGVRESAGEIRIIIARTTLAQATFSNERAIRL